MNPATVILQGGYALELDPSDSDPIVQALISGEIFTGPQNRILELRAAGGERLRFRAEAIVAVILPDGDGKSPRAAAMPSADKPHGGAAVLTRAPAGGGEPYVLMENFLTEAEHAEILRLTLAARDRFAASKTETDAKDYRASSVLNDEIPIVGLMRKRVGAALPDAISHLGLSQQEPEGVIPESAIECQVTAHNDGDFYRVHNDAGTPGTRHRKISYVYYFRAKPKPFQGGELRLYEVAVKDGLYVAGERFWLIEPKDNSIIFFPSHAMHEVLPTTCASGAFEDSRFTVNGWAAL